MKVAFIQNEWTDVFGSMYISSALRKNGFNCEYFIDSRSFLRDIASFSPDIICATCMTGNEWWVFEKAREIKQFKRNVKIVVGGPHPTYFPEMLEQGDIDAICIGEGEEAIVDYAKALMKNSPLKTIKNFWIKEDGQIFKNEPRDLINDLDTISFPVRSYYKKYKFLKNSPVKGFISHRGCPYDCNFCYNFAFRQLYKEKGKVLRARSPRNLIDEIMEVKTDYGLDIVQFPSDCFAYDKKWLEEFSRIYKDKVKLPYTCCIVASLVDEDMVKMLKESGCITAQFGIETGNETLRRNILNKYISNKDIERCAGLLRENGIRFLTFNMFGLPTETMEDAFKTIELNRLINVDYPWASILQPYPGTKIYDMSMKMGLISKKIKFGGTIFKTSTLVQKDINQIVNIQKFFPLMVKTKIFDSIIRKIVKLPANPIFDIFFLCSYAMCLKGKTHSSFKRIIKLGILHIFKFFK